jgi:hypothetical protein
VTGNEEQDVVPFIGAPEMAEVFSMTRQRVQPASPFALLSSSNPYVTLNNRHVLRAVHLTNEHTRERVLSSKCAGNLGLQRLSQNASSGSPSESG